MIFKFSSSSILICLVGLFVLLFLGMLVYSLRSINQKYHDYKLQKIMNSPYETKAKITDKYTIGWGFEIAYQFKGEFFEEAMKVKKEVYRKYKTGDNISITLSSNKPSFVILTDKLNNLKAKKITSNH